MKKTATPFAAALALMIGAAAPALAHHADVMFDKMKDMTISGTVTKFDYANPHTEIALAVPSRDAKPVIWHIETNSPLMLQKAGVDPMLREHEKVTMRIHPLKDGSPGGSLISLKKADGSEVMVPEPGKIFGTKPPPLPFEKNARAK